MTLEEIVNNLKSAGQDYGQLFNNNPRMDNFASVLQQGLGQLIPSNADFKSPEAMRDWGTAAALNAPMGLTFTGPKSMGWNHDAANTATKLLDNGADPAQVWKDHLIGRMPDKSLFSEIDDSGFRLSNEGDYSNAINRQKSLILDNANQAKELRLFKNTPQAQQDLYPKELNKALNSKIKNLSEDKKILSNEITGNYNLQWGKNGLLGSRAKYAYQHNDLIKKYPDVANDVVVRLERPSGDGTLGSLDGNSLNIYQGKEPNKTANSTGLHEFQHAIQDYEGWAQGGNPNTFEKERDAVYEKIKELNKAMDFHYKYAEEAKARGDLDMEKKFKAIYQDRLNERNALAPSVQKQPYDEYRKLTGEAQARATQDRMNMNMQQRRDTYPLAGDKLSDIPLDQLINRYGDNGPSMSMSIKNPNLNFELLNKHLSGQKLTPEEMALYEKNGSAMETPQLQRYNLGNANAQGGSPESRAIDNGYNTDVYHGMSARRDFWGNSPDLIALDSNTGKAEGGRLFSSDDPRIASQYSGHRTETPIIYPLSIKDDSIFSAPIKNWDVDKGGTTLNGINIADDIGKNTALFKGVVDTPGYNPHNEFLSNVYASKKDIRSRFAAFDPLRKNSSSLLASGLLGSLLLKQMNQESSQQ